MRGMLVHDDDAVGCLGDNIGLVQLRPRNTERKVGRHALRRGRLRFDTG